MKTELIEYHQDRRANLLLCYGMTKPDETIELEYYKTRIEFHDRAVGWLELLPECSRDYLEALKSVNEREPKVYSK